MENPDYRNYNIGREIDNKSEEFELELSSLIEKYDAYMETESFEGVVSKSKPSEDKA